MKLNKTDIKVIKQALEWCVENTPREDDVGTGRTSTKKIYKVLDKLEVKS